MSIVSVMVHLTVLAGYWWGDTWRRFPLSWSYSYTYVILLMMISAAIAPFINSARIRGCLLGVRLAAMITVAMPFASRPGSFGLIYALLTFEGFLYFGDRLALVLGVLLVVFLILLARLHLPLWFNPVEPVDVDALMTAWAQCLLSGAVGYCLVREERMRARDLDALEDLRSANTYLAETNINLQNLAAQAEHDTMAKERTRVAREIHDTIAYTLTNLLSLLDVHRERLQVNEQIVPEEVNQARTLARDGLSDIRLVLRGLRPRKDEGYNGLGSVMRLIEVFGQATGIEVRLSYGDAPQFPGEVLEAVFYRVVQEGLTNAFRHGRATQVFVSFCRLRDGIELTVRDNGRGTDTSAGGFGLVGIRERVGELGGTTTTTSQFGHGFTLRVWLPLSGEGEADGIDETRDR